MSKNANNVVLARVCYPVATRCPIGVTASGCVFLMGKDARALCERQCTPDAPEPMSTPTHPEPPKPTCSATTVFRNPKLWMHQSISSIIWFLFACCPQVQTNLQLLQHHVSTERCFVPVIAVTTGPQPLPMPFSNGSSSWPVFAQCIKL